jgi:DNA-binding transcriptional ArsR family regulator
MAADPDPELAELRRRLERIEEHLASRTDSGSTAVPDSTFWILEGLRTAPEPVVAFAGRVELAEQRPIEWQMGYRSADVLERDWADLAGSLSALGHPARLRLLQLVARGEATTAAELTRIADLGSTGQIYHHLRQLVAAGWLQTRSKGRHVVPPERLVPLLVILSACG